MQALLVEWLVRYNALLEPSDMETAMRDEVDLALASMLAAEVCPSSASILRVFGNAQPAGFTAARMCLIRSIYTHGENAGCSFCVSMLGIATGSWASQIDGLLSYSLLYTRPCTAELPERKLATAVPQMQPARRTEHARLTFPSSLARILS